MCAGGATAGAAVCDKGVSRVGQLIGLCLEELSFQQASCEDEVSVSSWVTCYGIIKSLKEVILCDRCYMCVL